jgi:hypothetical protein
MAHRLRELVREHRGADASDRRREVLAAQVAVLNRRHGLYSRALLLVYGSVFVFVLTSLLGLAQAFVAVPAGFPLALFGAGVVMLAAAALFVVAAIQLARATIRAEAREVLRRRRGALVMPGQQAGETR